MSLKGGTGMLEIIAPGQECPDLLQARRFRISMLRRRDGNHRRH